jgi:hypothetical protein
MQGFIFFSASGLMVVSLNVQRSERGSFMGLLDTVLNMAGVGTGVTVDYPQKGEQITGSRYSIRISAAQGLRDVEVSIDKGAWLSCRQTDGYWWFDWSAFSTGNHSIAARARNIEREFDSSRRHSFTVR